MRKICCYILLVSILLLVSCKALPDGTGTNSGPKTTNEEEKDDVKEEESSETKEEESKEMGTFEFSTLGDTIILPMKVEDVLALGWEEYSYNVGMLDEVIGPKCLTRKLFEKDEHYFATYIANLSEDKDAAIRECTIVGTEYPEQWELPGGIKGRETTLEEALEILGEPKSTMGSYYMYSKNGFNYNFAIDEETNTVKSLYIIFAAHNDFEDA